MSDEENSDSDSDSEDDSQPRPHVREYPPKQIGVQNVPWTHMPAELRNIIYEYCMGNEEEKVVNVLPYPHGIPRRSVRGISTTTNFAHSYWGLTQTCRQVRDVFTLCLLQKWRVRTPLATLNSYAETFHRAHPITGKRIGHIEPICTGAPLPGNGVEILELLKHKHDSPGFHLQLTPMPVNSIQAWLLPEPNPDKYDELMIAREIDNVFMKDSGDKFRKVGIEAIHISVLRKADHDENCDDDEKRSHDAMIQLDIGKPSCFHAHRNKQISANQTSPTRRECSCTRV